MATAYEFITSTHASLAQVEPPIEVTPANLVFKLFTPTAETLRHFAVKTVGSNL